MAELKTELTRLRKELDDRDQFAANNETLSNPRLARAVHSHRRTRRRHLFRPRLRRRSATERPTIRARFKERWMQQARPERCCPRAARRLLLFAGSLNVPSAVTLKGIWESVPAHNGIRDAGLPKPTDDGTTFLITGSAGARMVRPSSH